MSFIGKRIEPKILHLHNRVNPQTQSKKTLIRYNEHHHTNILPSSFSDRSSDSNR